MYILKLREHQKELFMVVMGLDLNAHHVLYILIEVANMASDFLQLN